MNAPLGALIGSRIRRVDVPDPDLLVLGLAQASMRTVLVFSTDPAAPGFGCVLERPRGLPAEGIGKQLRNLIEGARLERALDLGGGGLALDLRRGDDVIALIYESLEAHSNVLVLDARGQIVTALRIARLAPRGLAIGQTWSPRENDGQASAPETLSELLANGARLLDARHERRQSARRRALGRALSRAQRKIDRRASATLGDLARAREIPRLREHGSLILAHLSNIPKGATEIALPSFSGVPRETIIALNPELDAKANAAALFIRARKLETGAVIAQRRHEEARAIGRDLESIRLELEAARDSDLDALETRALRLGVKPEQEIARGKERPRLHTPFRRFRGAGHRVILVGKGARDNDELTFRHASPHDLWLHVRGMPGSHVIVPLSRSETCPDALFIDAAHLAAHFSSARLEPRVEVQATLRKYLRKPRSGPPGAVTMSNERSRLLHIERARIEHLLSTREDLDEGPPGFRAAKTNTP